MLKRRWPLLLVAVGLLAGLVYTFGPRPLAVEIVTVERRALVQSVVATGRLATPARVEISSHLAARIDAIEAREGDRVRAGQLLVRLRSEEAQATLTAARAALAEASDRMRQLVQVQRPVSEQQLVQAEASLTLAENESARTLELQRRGYVSQARVDETQRTLASTRAAVVAARAQSDALREDGIEPDLVRSRLAQARANLAAAEARLELLALRSPGDGTVLTRTAEPGDTAVAGRALLTLALAGETRIIATVDEKNLRHLKPSLAASAVADAYPGERFDARVFYVAPAVDPLRGTVEVRLAVDDPPGFLKPDMTVSVEMLVGRNPSALTLPADAVRAADGDSPFVLVLRDGRAVEVAVKLGLHGVGTVEIAEGLGEGDAVIASTSPALAGDRVRARTSVPARGNAQPIPGLTN